MQRLFSSGCQCPEGQLVLPKTIRFIRLTIVFPYSNGIVIAKGEEEDQESNKENITNPS
jgi:hypothetical protein